MLEPITIGQQGLIDVKGGFVAESFIINGYWMTVTYLDRSKKVCIRLGDLSGRPVITYKLGSYLMFPRKDKSTIYRKVLQNSTLLSVLDKQSDPIAYLSQFRM